MSTLEKEFFRTQREAGIYHAPWADSADLQRAAGAVVGVLAVGIGMALIMSFCAGLLRLLVSP